MKTNDGLKSVCSSCGDETSAVKEEVGEKRAPFEEGQKWSVWG